MRIGYCGINLNQKWRGVENYTIRLIRSMQKIEKDNKYVIYSERTSDLVEEIWIDGLDPLRTEIRILNEPITVGRKRLLKSLWDRIQNMQRFEKVDILHHVNANAPIPKIKRGKFVVTVQDLIFLTQSQFFNHNDVRLVRERIKMAIEEADVILAPSFSTIRDLQQYYGVSTEKTRVIYYAADENFRVIKDSTRLSQAFGKYPFKAGEYIFYTGAVEPRKNIEGLLQIYSHFKKMTPHKMYTLVIAGEVSQSYKEKLNSMIKQLELRKEDVYFTDYVADDDLILLMNGALLFVFPSYYEGFGFPPLEAMACGIPVITSNNSSLPEVIGKGGILVDVNDIVGFAKKMEEVVCNDEYRSEMINKGFEQLMKFSWEKTAKETLEVYKKVLHQ